MRQEKAWGGREGGRRELRRQTDGGRSARRATTRVEGRRRGLERSALCRRRAASLSFSLGAGHRAQQRANDAPRALHDRARDRTPPRARRCREDADHHDRHRPNWFCHGTPTSGGSGRRAASRARRRRAGACAQTCRRSTRRRLPTRRGARVARGGRVGAGSRERRARAESAQRARASVLSGWGSAQGEVGWRDSTEVAAPSDVVISPPLSRECALVAWSYAASSGGGWGGVSERATLMAARALSVGFRLAAPVARPPPSVARSPPPLVVPTARTLDMRTNGGTNEQNQGVHLG